jgi:tetratricopeptide (TPR) repeat protein
MTMPRKIVGSFRHRKLLLLVCASLVLISQPAAADSWYEHYFKAEQALENEDWMLAIQEINEALERKGDSGARVRSYGMNVISYFPYFKLGIAYYQLDQFDAALQAFETEARLGAIEKSADASTELERYRQLVRRAKQVAAAAEGQRIREIVADSMSRARELEEKGLLGEAMVALDQALAVAPDDVEARAAMDALRPRFAAWQRERALEQRAAKLVENGVALLDGRQFSEASSLFRQALLLTPGPEIQALLDEAQARLLAQIGTDTSTEGAPAGLDAVLDQVRALESAGRIAEALERLQATLAVAPSNADALSLQTRLLQAWQEAESERTRSMTIKRLLAEVASQFEAGLTEKSLSTANRILAIDPGNAEALSYVARAYRVISRDLLGSRPKGNIPPAVRFVDLRSENDNGMLVQTIAGPAFQLNGVIIDNSPVEVVFYREPGSVVEAEVNSQPLGEFYLTAFKVESRLAPGLTTYRLVATDAENLTSSSEYAVIYARPILRAPWFHALLLGIGLAVISALLWRRYHRLRQLRSRRFNPYVAGAPILEEEMFFGRGELVERILQTIHNNSLLIHGERRIGKTSIQHQLMKRLREIDDPAYEFHPVYIDLQGTAETRFFVTLAEEIFHELAPVLDGLEPIKELSGDYFYRDFVRDLHAILKTLRNRTSKKVKVVLLIDEVDELNEYDPRINQKLRSLFMKSFAENLAAVVSGVEIKRRWEREGSPWYNFFEEIEVAPLRRDDARELIRRPIRGMFKLDRGVENKIISITGGKPYLIQKVCISLVSRLHEQHRRRITMADVEAVGRPDGA